MVQKIMKHLLLVLAVGAVSIHAEETWLHYTSSSGKIASNSIIAIGSNENDGTVWFLSSTSVTRLQGSTWTTYTLGNGLPQGIRSLKDIAMNSDGRPWIAYSKSGEAGGALYFDGTWQKTSEINASPTKITLDSDNTPWLIASGLVGTSEADIAYKYEGNGWTRKSDALGATSQITDFEINAAGKLFVSHKNNGFLTYTGSGTEWKACFSAYGVNAFAFDGKYRIYGISGTGLIKSDASLCSGSFIANNAQNLGVGNTRTMVFEARQNKRIFWVGGENGIAIYTLPGSDNLQAFTPKGQAFTKTVNVIAMDSEGGKWIGTNEGLYYYKKTAETNNAPTDIGLYSHGIEENQPVGSFVGNLKVTDPDLDNPILSEKHSWSLVTGSGDDDNALFTLDDNKLNTASILDYETKKTCSIRIRVTDLAGASYEEVITVTVLNDPDDDGATAVGTINTNYTQNITLKFNGAANPHLTISIPYQTHIPTLVTITDLLGKVLFVNTFKGNGLHQIDLSNRIGTGIYFIRIQHGNNQITRCIRN